MIALGFLYTLTQTQLHHSVGDADRGNAMAFLGFSQCLAAAVGISVLGAVVSSSLNARLFAGLDDPVHAYKTALTLAFLATISFAGVHVPLYALLRNARTDSNPVAKNDHVDSRASACAKDNFSVIVSPAAIDNPAEHG